MHSGSASPVMSSTLQEVMNLPPPPCALPTARLPPMPPLELAPAPPRPPAPLVAAPCAESGDPVALQPRRASAEKRVRREASRAKQPEDSPNCPTGAPLILL